MLVTSDIVLDKCNLKDEKIGTTLLVDYNEDSISNIQFVCSLQPNGHVNNSLSFFKCFLMSLEKSYLVYPTW